MGYVSENNQDEVVDRHKIEREKTRVSCKHLKDREQGTLNLTCVGLDSKRDNNVPVLEEIIKDGKKKVFKSKATVDHLTFTAESGIFTLCHYVKSIGIPVTIFC